MLLGEIEWCKLILWDALIVIDGFASSCCSGWHFSLAMIDYDMLWTHGLVSSEVQNRPRHY